MNLRSLRTGRNPAVPIQNFYETTAAAPKTENCAREGVLF